MEILSGIDILIARNALNSSAVWLGDWYKETTNFSYWKKLQKLNIHSNTGKIYNSRAEIRKNRHTHTHTQKHTHTHTTSPYVTRMICNRRYWVPRYQKILINLGTIRIYKLDQTFSFYFLCYRTWEDLFFLDYVQWYYLDSSDKSISYTSI